MPQTDRQTAARIDYDSDWYRYDLGTLYGIGQNVNVLKKRKKNERENNKKAGTRHCVLTVRL